MAEPRYETIRPRTKLLGRRLIHLASVTSTMDEARRLAQEGADSGTVVVADTQTAGRGRAERVWHSPPGSLLTTLLLRAEVPMARLPLLSLAAGLSVARSIEKLLRIKTQLKWPNDVWIGVKKVAGILIETRVDGPTVAHVLVGIGLNGNLRPEDLPADVRSASTSLSTQVQRYVCLPALLKLLLEDFERNVDDLSAGRIEGLLAAVRERSFVLGKRVRVETSTGPAEGVAKEIGEVGELIVETSTGLRVVNVGDCQLLRTQ